MFKRSDGKRRRSKRSKRCKTLLGKVNKTQVRSSYKRILSKKSRKTKRRSNKKIRMDGVQINGLLNGLLNDEQKQVFRNIFRDNKYKFFKSITLKGNTSPAGAALKIVNDIYIKKNDNLNFTYNNHSVYEINDFSIDIISGYELADTQPSPAGFEPIFDL